MRAGDLKEEDTFVWCRETVTVARVRYYRSDRTMMVEAFVKNAEGKLHKILIAHVDMNLDVLAVA